MKVKYLSYKQAIARCQSHQHLAGAPYDKAHPDYCSVKAVLIAPYSRILQWKFLQYLAQGWPLADALSINVNERYDVLVLPDPWQTGRDGTLRYKCLRDYLEEHGPLQEANAGARPVPGRAEPGAVLR